MRSKKKSVKKATSTLQTKTIALKSPQPTQISKPAPDKLGDREIELDVNALLMPLALIVSALIISIPLSLSIYFGLKDANLGSAVESASAAECDPADPLNKDCLVSYAEDLGLDIDEFQSCYEAKKFDEQVGKELSYGEEIGVQGTPSVLAGENKNGKMRGIFVGSGVTKNQLEQFLSDVEKNGVNKAAEEWKKTQLAGLSAYETQLRDYYTQQGQTGDTLKNSVSSGLNTRKQEIESETQVKEYTYGDGLRRGNEDAKAVVMEFSDYECPYCQRFAQAEVGKYIKEQSDSGKLLFVYRDFPLESIHPKARGAANAARCAGAQDKYFEYHDKLFKVEE